MLDLSRWKEVVITTGFKERVSIPMREGFQAIPKPPETPSTYTTILLASFQILKMIKVNSMMENLVYWIRKIVGRSYCIFLRRIMCFDGFFNPFML